MLALLIVGLISLSVTMAAVPPIVRIARSRGLLDRPDCSRRAHSRPVPRLGGIAVWLGVAAGLSAWQLIASRTGRLTAPPDWYPGALVALVVMIATGLVDDIRDVRPRTKLLAQVAAALIVLAAGFRIDAVTLSGGGALTLGWLGAPITLLWIVAVTNAVNLIDGLDGLAGGITLVTVVALMASATLGGAPAVLPALAALAGGIIGFLRYNRSPARIFLGDVGSLSIGFALSLLSIEGARLGGGAGGGGAVAIVVASFVLAFPVLDTAIAMLRRWLRVVPLSGADGRHVHHQLVGLGLTHHRASALICLFASGMALLGLSITYAPPVLTVALSMIGLSAWVLLVIHGTRWLQYHEFQEAQASFTSGVRRARHVIRDRILARDLEAKVRTAGSIGEIGRLLEQHRKVLGFDVLALCDGSDLRHRLETALAITDQRPRLTFPVTGTGWGAGEGMLIVASWKRDTRQPPLYAERVIRIVVPAVEEALARIGAPVRQLDLAPAVGKTAAMAGKLPFGGAEEYVEKGAPARVRRVAGAVAR